jgi:hypothetical protein
MPDKKDLTAEAKPNARVHGKGDPSPMASSTPDPVGNGLDPKETDLW